MSGLLPVTRNAYKTNGKTWICYILATTGPFSLIFEGDESLPIRFLKSKMSFTTLPKLIIFVFVIQLLTFFLFSSSRITPIINPKNILNFTEGDKASTDGARTGVL